MPMPKVKPTGPLADIVGSKKMLRSEVVAKVWDYIKKKKLMESDNIMDYVRDRDVDIIIGELLK